MNLAFFICKFLQEREVRVSVPLFGVFFLEKKHAVVDEQSLRILPPSEKVYFEKKEENSDVLAQYISNQTGESLLIIRNKIKMEVEGWNQELFSNKKLVLDGLGVIELLGGVDWSFISGELDTFSFGLEAINLQNIKENSKDYTLRKSILWMVVVFLLSALIFLGIRYQDLIFENVSFEGIYRVKGESKLIVKTDSLSLDSLVVDSLDVWPKEIAIPNRDGTGMNSGNGEWR